MMKLLQLLSIICCVLKITTDWLTYSFVFLGFVFFNTVFGIKEINLL